MEPAAVVGDSILVLNRHWFDLMLQGLKTLEIRSCRLQPGTRLVGEQGVVWGSVVIGDNPFQVMSDAEWNALRPRHQWPADKTTLPYKKTWAMEVANIKEFTSPLRYLRIHGQFTTATYREVPDGWKPDKVYTLAEYEGHLREKGPAGVSNEPVKLSCTALHLVSIILAYFSRSEPWNSACPALMQSTLVLHRRTQHLRQTSNALWSTILTGHRFGP